MVMKISLTLSIINAAWPKVRQEDTAKSEISVNLQVEKDDGVANKWQ